MWGGLAWEKRECTGELGWALWWLAVNFARSDSEGERAIEKERSARERGDTKIDEAECQVDGEVVRRREEAAK